MINFDTQYPKKWISSQRIETLINRLKQIDQIIFKYSAPTSKKATPVHYKNQFVDVA
jgi:hypothetical protein